MSTLETIIDKGNVSLTYWKERPRGQNHIVCADGFSLSVIAGEGTYCSPRPGGWVDGDPGPEYQGPYDQVEVGFPSTRPEPWGEWARYCEDREKPTQTVYGYVPVEMVRALVESHGGEV